MMRRLLLLALSACTLFAQDGAAIYKKRCAGCHDAPVGRVPPFSVLRAMDPGRILHSLEGGSMKAQAEGMSSIERHALMSYLVSATPKASAPLPSTAFCAGDTGVLSDPLQGPRWNGWGVDFANTRFQDTVAAGFTAGDVPKLKLKWAFGLGDGIVARALPAIAGGRVFVGSESGAVYSLDARAGCIHWVFQADGGVTAAAIIGTAGRRKNGLRLTSATRRRTSTQWIQPLASCSGRFTPTAISPPE